MSLINKMNVGNTNYDIQDRLMPDAIGQAGQVLRVKDDASGLEFSDTEAGSEKLYQHYVKMNYNGQHTAIIFKSSRPISYSLLDLIEYIQTFPEHNFTAKLLIGDNWYAFPYDTYITADSSSIAMWYANKNIGYGSDFEDTINANEIISDTVTEL